MLRKYEDSLRLLFGGFAQSEGTEVGKEHLVELMALGEWMALLKGLDFIGPDLTEREATLCFVNARMAVIDVGSAKGAVCLLYTSPSPRD